MKKKMLAAAALTSGLASVIGSSAASAAISDIYANDVAGQVSVTGTVTEILNVASTTTTFLTQDGTGSVLSYNIPKATYTPTVGDNVTYSAYNSPYQGSPELTNGSSGAFSLTSQNSTGNIISPVSLTVPQFKATGNYTTGLPPDAEALVTLIDVSFAGPYPASLPTATSTTYTLTDVNGDTTPLYDYKSDSAVVAGATAANTANPGGFSGTYDITGYVDEYYGEAEIYPVSYAEISTAAVPEPVSLSFLSLGSVALLARRRRRV